MRQAENSLPSQYFYRASIDIARDGLRRILMVQSGSDTELIRIALNGLLRKKQIARYSDLVTLRWVTILLEHLPESHPERAELYQSWYLAKDRAKDVI